MFFAFTIVILRFSTYLAFLFEVHTFPPLSFAFFLPFFFFFFVLASLLKMALTNPAPPSPNYKSLYRWAPRNLLKETSNFTTHTSIMTYKKSEDCHKSRIFGKEHDRFVRVVPRRVGEPVCYDESSDSEVLEYMA